MTPAGAFWLAACSIAAGYAACELTHRIRRAARDLDRIRASIESNADSEALEPWAPVASCCVTEKWCRHRSPFGPMQVAADESTLRRWVDEGRDS